MTPQERLDLRALRTRAKELGCVLEIDRSCGMVELTVTAPEGFRFEMELHQYVDSCYKGWEPDYVDMLSRLQTGIEVCDDPDCDWCRSESDP